jgi:hypothetical protein
MIDIPPYILWTLLIAMLGWLLPHLLRASRDRQAKRIDDTKASRLSDIEREVLHHCASADGHANGCLWILSTDAHGSWVRAGQHDFFDQSDASIRARYLDAFESLNSRGYFRYQSGMMYRLTDAGFEMAKHDT